LLGLLRLLRLLRFLSHSILSGFNGWKRDTRGMLGGGPASQHPRMLIQQIRRPLPRAVTPPSSRYPQMKCIFDAISWKFPHRAAGDARAARRLAPGDGGIERDPCTMGGRLVRVNGAATRWRGLDRSGTDRALLHDFKTTAAIAAPR
ncbi:MAG TPA: hypothetical protein VN065_19375, partial [Bradyrhizobium sp.]|nr:hypothetical protein [Bradyrhizobium sp.]